MDEADPDENWTRAARVFRQSRAAYQALQTRLAVISAPAELASAHDGLVRSLPLFARYVGGYATALETRRPAELREWAERAEPTARRMTALRRAWRTQVFRYARDVGVVPPEWVRSVGAPLASS